MRTRTKLVLAALLLLLIILAWPRLGRGSITGQEARELVERGALLLDVRTATEFAAGHVPSAINLPVQELPNRIAELPDKARPIVVYCGSGQRSARAQGILERAGYRVYDLGAMSRWPEPERWTAETLPPQLGDAARRADAAMDALQSALLVALTKKLASGPPSAAIEACRTLAPAATASIAQSNGLELGRTSFRLRNPQNAPRAWAKAYVEAAAGRRPADLPIVYFDLVDRLGVLRPIPVGAPCVTCHGAKERLEPALAAAIAGAYPNDQAVGFSEGQLRGFFWAEARKTR